MREIYKQHKLPPVFYVISATDTLDVNGPLITQFNSLQLTHKDGYSILSTNTEDQLTLCELLCFIEQLLDIKKVGDPYDCLPYTHVCVDNQVYKDFTSALANSLLKTKQAQL